jgi:hypothetical protein
LNVIANIELAFSAAIDRNHNFFWAELDSCDLHRVTHVGGGRVAVQGRSQILIVDFLAYLDPETFFALGDRL